MYGSRHLGGAAGGEHRNASVRASLVAVLVGAVLAGGTVLTGRMSHGPAPSPVTYVAVVQPVTTTPVMPTTLPTTTVPPTTHPTTTTATTHVTTTTTTPPPVTTTTTTPPPSPAQQVFALVNQARARAGCNPLTDDPRLDQAAQQHSDDMSSRDYFSHTTPEGVTFDQRETAAGYPSPGGENIAQGYTSAQAVMNGWMNSSGHRANILNCSFVAIGIGLDTRGWYWTQDFGR